jgi:PE family
MSFVTTQPELLAVAAGNLQGIGSAMTAGNAAVVAPTTGVVPAAADEVGYQRRIVCGHRGRQCGCGTLGTRRFSYGFRRLTARDQLRANVCRPWVGVDAGRRVGLGRVGRGIAFHLGQVTEVQRVENREQEPVAERPEPGDVQRRSATDEPRPFDEVVAVGQEVHIVGDLAGRHAAVRVHHDDDVTGGGQKAGAQRAAFARALLLHDPDVGPASTGGNERDIGRITVHENDFGYLIDDLLKHPADVARLIPDRNNQADGRICGGRRSRSRTRAQSERDARLFPWVLPA